MHPKSAQTRLVGLWAERTELPPQDLGVRSRADARNGNTWTPKLVPLHLACLFFGNRKEHEEIPENVPVASYRCWPPVGLYESCCAMLH